MRRRTRILLVSAVLAWLTALIVVIAIVSQRRATPTISIADPTQEQKMWCLAACAVLTRRNGDRLDVLGGAERTDANIDSWMGNLSEGGWGIDDRETLFESLRWIERGGHRMEFQRLALYLSSAEKREIDALETKANRDPELKNQIELVRKYYAELGDRSLVGFDYSRYLSLCGWGYLIGYLSEGEAWGLMLPAARILQRTFDSWEDLGSNYLIGRQFWSFENTRVYGASVVQAYDWLRSDPESPWLRIPWDLDLGADESGGSIPEDRRR